MRRRTNLVHEINRYLIGRGATGTIEFDNVEINIVVLFSGFLQFLKQIVRRSCLSDTGDAVEKDVVRLPTLNDRTESGRIFVKFFVSFLKCLWLVIISEDIFVLDNERFSIESTHKRT
ncbi:hypothetical protein C437_12296 [Haloarcula vallismortis ATCC 29715]|uniref:Uncharacterized protein n=1 Tax=Haloarcula vallismortis ATCC 29715 TaxID=662477 RepID=M0JCQ5_HALVA|nr:hypothetical protein C437_12296 [Haloarcula vallismortis ATCC 29715]